MKKIWYNKLVRDKIPEKIRAKGSAFETRTLSDDVFINELRKKISEEALGVERAKSRRELIGELADVIDVIEEIKRAEFITDTDIHSARQLGLQKKGGFSERVFLEWAEDDGYQTNEKK